MKLQKQKLTQQEWWEAMKTPTPHKNKKKYSRKEKYKKQKHQY